MGKFNLSFIVKTSRPKTIVSFNRVAHRYFPNGHVISPRGNIYMIKNSGRTSHYWRLRREAAQENNNDI